MSETTPMPASGPGPVTHEESVGSRIDGSYVDWSAVFAGAVSAAALFFLFSAFGAAIGLTVVSPWTYGNPSAETFGIWTAVWFVVIQIGSFAAGGYVAGRLRRRFGDSTDAESDFRDGAHGLLVWAVGFLVSALIVTMTATSIIRAGVQGAASAAGGAMQAMQSGGGLSGMPGLDQLFRSERPPAEGQDQAVRAEAARILADAVTSGELADADRRYLAQVIAARTGVSPQQAEQRITSALETARNAAEQARRAAVLTGFLTAASLLASLGAAWLAAQGGGNQRDRGTTWPGWNRAVPIPARFRRTSEQR